MTVCNSCRHSFQTKAQIESNFDRTRNAYAVARDERRARDGLLSSAEIVQIREHLGLRQREAAALFGGGSNAFNKYESGEVLQSVPMDRLLRLASGVGMYSVKLLQAVVEGRQLAHDGATVTLSRPLPSVLHISDGQVVLKLSQQSSIRKVMNIVESSTFRSESMLDASGVVASGATFYLQPSMTVSKSFIEKQS